MNRFEFLHRFEFYYHAIINQQVQSEIIGDIYTFIIDLYLNL